MALPKHWLDDFFDKVQNSDELLSVLLKSAEMQEIAAEAFEAGQRQRKAFDETSGLCGPGVSQVIRQAFLDGMNEPSRESVAT